MIFYKVSTKRFSVVFFQPRQCDFHSERTSNHAVQRPVSLISMKTQSAMYALIRLGIDRKSKSNQRIPQVSGSGSPQSGS
jgi:hypothetical protein